MILMILYTILEFASYDLIPYMQLRCLDQLISSYDSLCWLVHNSYPRKIVGHEIYNYHSYLDSLLLLGLSLLMLCLFDLIYYKFQL